MKPTYILQFLILFSTSLVYAQNDSLKTHGLFYKLSLATTLKINEDYDATCDCDSGETFIEPSALFVNNMVGYQFDKRASLGVNFEYAWHSEQGLHFLPTYLSFQYNLIGDLLINSYTIFIRGGYGTLLGISKDFEKGNLYKIGTGVMIIEEDAKPHILMGLDFTRKRFGHKNIEGISSVSIFIEAKFL